MKRILMAFAGLIVAGTATASASEGRRCPQVQSGTGLPIEQVIAKAEALGYAVKEAKRKGGCWEVEGYDRNGAEIEIYFDASSGEPVKPRNWRAPAGR